MLNSSSSIPRPKINYQSYIKSPEWAEKKRHWISLFGDKCICGRPGTNLHHRTYKSLGTEPPHQLVLLCRSCHLNVHTRAGKFTTDVRKMRLNLRRLLRKYGVPNTHLKNFYPRTAVRM